MIFSHISALVRPPHILVRDIPGGKETFHSIDALRGIAALTVVIFHYKNFFRGTADQSVLLSQVKTTPLFSALAPVMEHGALAVMLFWLISGFVFMHVHAGRAREISARHYAVHRFSRLYPLHFATLMIVAVMQIVSMYAFDGWQIYQNQDLKHFVLQIFMASNWGLEDGHSFNGPIWSVSAEIAIYAAFFVFIKNVRPTLLNTGVTMIGFAGLFLATDAVVALCGLYFFAGALCYGLYRLGSRRAPVIGIIVSLAVVGASALAPGPLTIALVGGFGGMVIALAFLEEIAPRVPFVLLRSLGDLSYAVYLLHTPVQIAFLLLVSAQVVPFDIVASPIFSVFYFVFICLLAHVVFLRYERPAQSWLRRRLLPAQSRAPA